MSVDIVPKDLRGLRACLVCSLIKVKYCIPFCLKPRYKQAFKEHVTDFQTKDQFEMDGCDNCEEFLHIKNNADNMYDCTSSNFDG